MAKDDDKEVQEAPKGGMAKMLIMGAGALLLLGAGVFLGPMVSSLIGGEQAQLENAEEGEEGESTPDPGGPALYTSLHPPLVVNFEDNGKRHFLQVAMDVMAREQWIIDEVKNHSAAIRNNLLLMLGTVDYQTVISREGKIKLQADALSEVQAVLQEKIGEPGVEAVYFTSLIVQ
jgi:flagellar FliL protein